MFEEETKQAVKKCRQALKTCSKKELIDLYVEVLEYHHPERLRLIAEKLEKLGG